jgi:dTDP-4-dehydrorhamnose reductase
MKQIKEGKKVLSAVDDKLGSPTYTRDFAATIGALIVTGNYGLYHSVGQGDCSRYEVGEEILRLLNLQDTITLKKVDSSFWAKEYFAPRPRSEKLTNLKLGLRGINTMRHWKETLKEYIGSYDWGLPS